jgi:hypothetical protein
MKVFSKRFLSVLFAFGLLNVIWYYLRSDPPVVADAVRRVGFPFVFRELGGFAGASTFSLVALIGDIAVALVVSALCAMWDYRSAIAGAKDESALASGAQQSIETGEECELCLSCLNPNSPGTHFCSDCGAPLSSYAATGPFELLFADGYVYRNAAERPSKAIVLLGMWLIFGLVGFAAVPLLVLSVSDSSFAELLSAVLLLGVCPIILGKTTRNYFRRNRYEQLAAE